MSRTDIVKLSLLKLWLCDGYLSKRCWEEVIKLRNSLYERKVLVAEIHICVLQLRNRKIEYRVSGNIIKVTVRMKMNRLMILEE